MQIQCQALINLITPRIKGIREDLSVSRIRSRSISYSTLIRLMYRLKSRHFQGLGWQGPLHELVLGNIPPFLGCREVVRMWRLLHVQRLMLRSYNRSSKALWFLKIVRLHDSIYCRCPGWGSLLIAPQLPSKSFVRRKAAIVWRLSALIYPRNSLARVWKST